jgi:hypothetical protein
MTHASRSAARLSATTVAFRRPRIFTVHPHSHRAPTQGTQAGEIFPAPSSTGQQAALFELNLRLDAQSRILCLRFTRSRHQVFIPGGELHVAGTRISPLVEKTKDWITLFLSFQGLCCKNPGLLFISFL